MTYIEVESSAQQRPLEIDTTSSKAVVYLRRNIREAEEAEKEEGIFWRMEEAKVPVDEYKVMQGAAYQELKDQLEAQAAVQDSLLTGQQISDEAVAELMLNQMDIINAMEAQEETLAMLLLSAL